MKKGAKIRLSSLAIIGFFLIILTGYKKKEDNSTNTAPTLTIGALKDVDGNSYDTVRIGTQVWMIQNLKTTKYNDGTEIPLVTDRTTWLNLTSPGYCWYNNDSIAFKTTYGALYNWYTVNTGKLAPKGWHIPTDAEWTTLITYLGGNNIAGGKLKETGTTHWQIPNSGATNETGFTGLPGGYRNNGLAFNDMGNVGGWWSSSECGMPYAWFRCMYYNSSSVSRTVYNKEFGFPVRCIRD